MQGHARFVIQLAGRHVSERHFGYRRLVCVANSEGSNSSGPLNECIFAECADRLCLILREERTSEKKKVNRFEESMPIEILN
jgi:hypothetical protein